MPNNINTYLFLWENSNAASPIIEHWMTDMGVPDVIPEDNAMRVLGLFEQSLDGATAFYSTGEPYFGEPICDLQTEYIPRGEFWGALFPDKKIQYCVWVDKGGQQLYNRKLEAL